MAPPFTETEQSLIKSVTGVTPGNLPPFTLHSQPCVQPCLHFQMQLLVSY